MAFALRILNSPDTSYNTPAMRAKKRLLRYIQKITKIKPQLVGSLLNAGVHHRVYAYGKQHVIKIPRRRFNFLYSKHSHLENDLSLLNTYFPGLVVETQVFASADKKNHCIIQKKVATFTYITPQLLARQPQVQLQLEKLLVKNRSLLRRHSSSLDLLGGNGFTACLESVFFPNHQPYFSNMVLYKGKLRLLDSELLRYSFVSLSFEELVRTLLSLISLAITEICLRLFYRLKL
jgi:hypothetical protein